MTLIKLYDCKDVGQMNVVGLMSGSGTNLVKIIEHEQRLKREREISPYHVAVIFSDNPESKAVQIGRDYDIPIVIRYIKRFYQVRRKPIKGDVEVRPEYDAEIVKALRGFDCRVAALAGYEWRTTPVFINAFLGVNVHPADLTIVGTDGKRKYIGNHAVRDAIKAGEREIRSTTHIVTEEFDGGPILMVSAPLKLSLGEHFSYDDIALVDSTARAQQSKLKVVGDWVIFPKTLEYLADGRYARDEKGLLYFDGKEIPQGVKLEA